MSRCKNIIFFLITNLFEKRKGKETLACHQERESLLTTLLVEEFLDGGDLDEALYRKPLCSTLVCGFEPSSPSSPPAGGCCSPYFSSVPVKEKFKDNGVNIYSKHKTHKQSSKQGCAVTLCLRLSFLLSSVSWSIFSFQRSKKYDGSE